MNNLLIDDYPLIVLPSLAKHAGLNEAIMLQQIHFWIQRSQHFKENKKWVYNTYSGWVYQFPFWSESTIKRTIRSLERQNLLLTGNFNKLKIDNTKWYSINYQELKRVTRWSGQNEQTDGSKWTDGPGQNDQAITIDYPETTTETIPYAEIVGYLNEKADKNFKHTTRKTQDVIKARWNEGFRLDDFKKVIDICSSQWKGKTFNNGQAGDNYLQPSTLFNGKFEERLNWVNKKSSPEQPKKSREQIEHEKMLQEMGYFD